MPYSINDDDFVKVRGVINGPGTGYVITKPGTIVTVDAGADGVDVVTDLPALETAATFATLVAGGSPRFIYVEEDENASDAPGLYFFDGASYFALTMTLYVPE